MTPPAKATGTAGAGCSKRREPAARLSSLSAPSEKWEEASAIETSIFSAFSVSLCRERSGNSWFLRSSRIAKLEMESAAMPTCDTIESAFHSARRRYISPGVMVRS